MKWGALLRLPAAAGVALLGSCISVTKEARVGPAPSLPHVPSQVATYLAEREAPFASDLVAGTQKTVFWHDSSTKERTRFAVVFLHGYTGSHATMAPMPERVARELRANLFCTRYAGHGRKDSTGYGQAMGDATLQDWIDDTREALEVGHLIGEQVVVIANSTAAPLACWLAAEGHAPDVLVLLSPNFGPKDWRANLLLSPWGPQLLELMEGETKEYDPEEICGPEHERYATTRYPAKALLTMMGSVQLGRVARLEKITAPTLCLYSELDQVVSPRALKKHVGRIGSTSKRIEEVETAHRDHHVLAGSIMSDEASTARVVDRIVSFAREHTPR